MKAVIVLSTYSENFDTKALAAELVEKRLAACVNIVPNIMSIYRWREEVEHEYEQLMMIKTSEARVEDLRQRLLESHPYDVPEFVVLEIDRVEDPYLRWLVESVS